MKVGNALYQIRAVLEREPDRTTQALILGPSFVVSSASLEASGLDQPGSLLHRHYRLRLPEAVSPAATSPSVR